MRLRCHLLGCIATHNPSCDRCRAYLYDDFLERGRLTPLLNAWARLCWKLTHGPFFGRKRCAQCGKWFWLGYNDNLCSEECHDVWLPF